MLQLTLTDEQAYVVARACEFFARIKLGQFSEITWELLSPKGMPGDEYDARREEAERLLFAARKQIYPALLGPGHSYGIGKFKDADQAFDVYQVIRPYFGDDRIPFSYYPLPKCEKIKGEDDE